MNTRSNSIHYRGLVPDDMDQVQSLLETREGIGKVESRKRRELMAWLAFMNPNANGDEPTYFVAEDQGRIVGFHGRMPVEFLVKGNIRKGYYVHDLYVHPQYRDKGLGFWITMALAKTIEEHTESFFCLLGMTELNKQMQRRRGYLELATWSYVKPLVPLHLALKTFKIPMIAALTASFGKLFLRGLDQLAFGWSSPRLEIEEVTLFDARFDQFATALRNEIGISSFKSSAYLNWKYAGRPHRRDTILAAVDGTEIRGFIVLALNPYERRHARGTIVDILVRPEDYEATSTLLRSAIAFFRSKDVESISFFITDRRYEKVLRRHLFLRKSHGKLLMLGNLSKCSSFEKRVLSDIAEWHLTLGESDSYMLSP